MCKEIKKLSVGESIALRDLIQGVCEDATALSEQISARQIKRRRTQVRHKFAVRGNHDLFLKLFDPDGSTKTALIEQLNQHIYSQLHAANDAADKAA